MSKTRIFISQPMRGRTDQEILKERDKITEELKKKYEGVEIIDSFFDGPVASPLWYLGESIKKLSEADIAVFAPGWDEARGCKIEYTCAYQYNIPIIYMEG